MWRSVVLGSLVLSVSNIASAQSLFSAVDPAPETGSVVAAAPEVQSNPITGFIEFLFGDAGRQSQRGQQWFGAPPRQDSRDEQEGRLAYANASSDDPLPDQQRSDDRIDPRLLRQEVGYKRDRTAWHYRHRHVEPLPLSGPTRGPRNPIWHRRRPGWLHVVGKAFDFGKKGMAGLGAAR